jgi:uncharacterized protein (TIGR03067 family)
MKQLLVLSAVLVLTPSLRSDEVDKELARLQGRYSVEKLEENGKAESPDEIKKFSVAIEGTKFIITMDGKSENMSIQIDPDRAPKWINLTPNFGDDKGKTFRGIYELDSTTLRICSRPKEKGDRPTKFVSEPGTMILVLKRK